MTTLAERAASPRERRRDPLSSWLRALAILLLAGALGGGAYLAWSLWGTGLVTAGAQDRLRADLLERMPGAVTGPRAQRAGEQRRVSALGEGLAIIQIPRIGLDMVVVEGTDPLALRKGPGHYAGTAYPWERRGRVAIAGHRTTYLHPFGKLDALRRGDSVRLLTEYGTFTYRVSGQRIVDPNAKWVLRQTRRPTLALTACHPRFSAAQRLVVFADRVAAWRAGPAPDVVVPVQARGPHVGPPEDVAGSFTTWVVVSMAAGGLLAAAQAGLRRVRG